jgi:hypothetical protein
MTKKRYPAITVLGGEKISALYGVDNGIVDWKGVGIQHFFYDSYEYDLIHSGVTYIKHTNNVVELGNRLINGKSHPIHQHPSDISTKEGYLYQTSFKSQEVRDISWVEEVYAWGDNKIVFETKVSNEGSFPISLELGSYIILRNPGGGKVEKIGDGVIWEGSGGALRISLDGAKRININPEAPTGFVYRTMANLIVGAESPSKLSASVFIGVTIGRVFDIPVGGSATVRWSIAGGINPDSLLGDQAIDWDNQKKEAEGCWKSWLENGVYKSLDLEEEVRNHYQANLAAIKGAILGGFVPADITGHYFAHGSPCYYARDAMMIARAFLLSGHYYEAKSIINYLINRPTKNNSGEFYQRYNALGQPSEGANNNVPHQLDSQGYFMRNLYTYYQRTGEWLLTLDEIKLYVNVLKNFQGQSGMLGLEGGVNEGVFGPAFITSSNMFIYGGLMAAIEIAKHHGDEETSKDWSDFAKAIDLGIQSTWLDEDGRYGYGYVEYDKEVVRKYDTPQYFGPLYGYPLSERIERNNKFMLKHSVFFGHGIGYTEQEYHHGPWMFNTGACAQYQALTGNFEQYNAKVKWMIEHSNGYGLMPEAVDAQDENRSFINPLTWACAEFVSTISILATEDGFKAGTLVR